jgi:hypothetical protein
MNYSRMVQMLKTCELSGTELDYWVAKAEGFNPVIEDGECWLYVRDNSTAPVIETSLTASWGRKGTIATRFRPSQDWFDGGSILESTVSVLCRLTEETVKWSVLATVAEHSVPGATLLEAAMRAYILSKFGEEVSECKTQ